MAPPINLFESYFAAVKSPEVPMTAHRWSLVVLLGSAMERRVWLPFGNGRIFPNQYVLLVGDPGSRKSTGIKLAGKTFEQCGFASFSSDKTSKEKFLLDLSESSAKQNGLASIDSSVELVPSVARIVADEFLDLIGPSNLDFLTLLGNLWDWDKDTPYKHSKTTGKSASIFQPTVSLIGGATHETLAQAIPISALGTGFMSRLLLIHVQSTGQKDYWPAASDPHSLDKFKNQLTQVTRLSGPMSPTPEAHNALKDIYQHWIEIEDARFKHYSTRRYTHLLKNAMLVALAKGSLQISKDDVIYANSYLGHAENNMSKALGELGNMRGSMASQAVLSAILGAGPLGLTADRLFKQVSTRLDQGTTSELGRILTTLEQSGKIYPFDQKWCGVQQQISRRQPHMNMDLLKGIEVK
jgi:hypothetical protein